MTTSFVLVLFALWSEAQGVAVDEKRQPNEGRTPALLREEDYDAWLNASLEQAPSFFDTFGSDDLQAQAAPAAPPSKPAPHPAAHYQALLPLR